MDAANALWFDVTWLASLVPLYRAEVLRPVDLGLRRTSAGLSVGLALAVFFVTTLFDVAWQTVLTLGSVASPFAGVAYKSTPMIVLTGVAAVVSPVVEVVFFQGLLFRCFRNRFALLPASVMTGMMFALVHTEYELVVLPAIAVYGGLACWLYERTGSLFPVIAINLYLDAGGFERALFGTSVIVFWAFVLLVVVLLVWNLGSKRRRVQLQA